MPARRTLEAAKLLFSGHPDQCWNLPPGVGGPHGNGYYKITVSGQRWYAHRLAYTLLVGPIPQGLDLDHLCHTNDPACPGGEICVHRACCNPAHLETVTPAENALRNLSPVAQNARKTHCDQGHELVPKGPKSIGRYCPICRMKNRIATGETSGNGHVGTRDHCPQGHPYDEENTYIYRPNGKFKCRMCRACSRERERLKRLRKQGES